MCAILFYLFYLKDEQFRLTVIGLPSAFYQLAVLCIHNFAVQRHVLSFYATQCIIKCLDSFQESFRASPTNILK
jgi:hypothetical protein